MPGSSPRVWGTQTPGCGQSCKCRFIPTRVGNTPAQRAPIQGHAVHPHACGEHIGQVRTRHNRAGSSPRVWGTRLWWTAAGDAVRFIPTRVGNTGLPITHPHCCTVHPHACGEHGRPRFTATEFGGSSPRVWGTRLNLCGREADHRFIPTRVGNTPPCLFGLPGWTVHPHACGEHGNKIALTNP